MWVGGRTLSLVVRQTCECILFPERAQMSMEAHLLETGNELQYEVECKILLEQKQSSLSDI